MILGFIRKPKKSGRRSASRVEQHRTPAQAMTAPRAALFAHKVSGPFDEDDEDDSIRAQTPREGKRTVKEKYKQFTIYATVRPNISQFGKLFGLNEYYLEAYVGSDFSQEAGSATPYAKYARFADPNSPVVALHGSALLVKPAYRRQGLASEMYRFGEEVFGLKILPGGSQSPAAVELYKGREENRKRQALYEAILKQVSLNAAEMHANAFRESYYGSETPQYKGSMDRKIKAAVQQAQNSALQIATVMASEEAATIPEYIGYGLIAGAATIAAVVILPELLVGAGIMEAGMTMAEAVALAGEAADAAIAAAELGGTEALTLDTEAFALWEEALAERLATGAMTAEEAAAAEETSQVVMQEIRAKFAAWGGRFVETTAEQLTTVAR